jgi:ELWxxDGT repeat protein
LFTAVNYGNKFIFTAYHQNYDFELWESDGTAEGTKLFKEVAPGPLSAMIYTLPPFDFTNGTVGQSLFQGNKFFMMVVLPNVGTELWVCNGTAEGTVRVKNINTDDDDGLSNLSYVYSTSGLYFAANDGVHGDELWKSDATETGTERITDINPGIADADISVSFMKVNNKILFNATDGDHLTAHDLYALELGSTLPVKLLDFTASTKLNDALLQWSTSQEINSRDFTVERSFDGKNFSTIGTVKATGSSSSKKEYSYTDKDVLASGKDVVYYRLLINDRDGKSVTSKVISVKIKGTAEWNIKLVNNPVISNMVLALSGITDNVQLSIKDVTGKTVHNAGRFNSNGQVSVAADRLTPGIYILVAETNSERKTIRFVKQ